ncbi:hypothetical protein [Actinophytocola sp.]|uniref:hypothetical protein n=1 Tax=Actinophytocola sp. TaxID=1872138 RepID=UPI0025C39DC5|nr:hypothetical protein [Actinophytocola sp.]
MPAQRSAAFREAFFVGAQRMHDDGGIELEFGATLHRAVSTRDNVPGGPGHPGQAAG